jgi:hypothetical protein
MEDRVPGRLLRVGAAIAACTLFATGCGSQTPDFVGSWTASGECHLGGLARAEFAKDGGFRGAARVSSTTEPAAKTLYGARYDAMCADVTKSAIPVDGTWHEDGPRIVVETSGTFGTRVVLYHRVADGTLTLANDGGFRDGVQSYVRAK